MRGNRNELFLFFILPLIVSPLQTSGSRTVAFCLLASVFVGHLFGPVYFFYFFYSRMGTLRYAFALEVGRGRGRVSSLILTCCQQRRVISSSGRTSQRASERENSKTLFSKDCSGGVHGGGGGGGGGRERECA